MQKHNSFCKQVSQEYVRSAHSNKKKKNPDQLTFYKNILSTSCLTQPIFYPVGCHVEKFGKRIDESGSKKTYSVLRVIF